MPSPSRCDGKGCEIVYISRMRVLLVLALFGMLAAALWFAGIAWVHLGGDPIPLYGWFAIVGGVVFSLAVGGGLMALVFYSSRKGYDEEAGGGDKRR